MGIIDDFMKREITANLLRYAVQRQMFCPVCSGILDYKHNAVLVETKVATACICCACFKKSVHHLVDKFGESLEVTHCKGPVPMLEALQHEKEMNRQQALYQRTLEI